MIRGRSRGGCCRRGRSGRFLTRARNRHAARSSPYDSVSDRCGRSVTKRSLAFLMFLFLAIMVIPFEPHLINKNSYFNSINKNDSNNTAPGISHHNDHYQHMLLLDESVDGIIKKTNSSDYTWVGDHWTPPPGVPVFTPRQLKNYFSRRNVLVVGDSTSRRFYETLYNIMNASNLDDIKTGEIDTDSYKEKYVCGPEMGYRIISNPNIMGINAYHVCLNNTRGGGGGGGGKVVKEYFKFDHLFYPCYNQIETSLWQKDDVLAELTQAYDLIIIAMGIWEEMTKIWPHHCSGFMPHDSTAEDRVLSLLESIETRTDHDSLQVVLRTSGFDTFFEEDDNKLIRGTNAKIGQFFHDLDEKLEFGRYEKNLTFADWGNVMASRSNGKDRIIGNIHSHYGLEARLLEVQQITHELVKSELMARDFQMKKFKP